jgi:Mg2+ and Co2+ transporter CorA
MDDLGALGIKVAGGLGGLVSAIGMALMGSFLSRLAKLEEKMEAIRAGAASEVDVLRHECNGRFDEIREDFTDAHEKLRLEFKADVASMKSEIAASMARLADKLEENDDNLTEHRVYVERMMGQYAQRDEIMSAFADIKSRLK